MVYSGSSIIYSQDTRQLGYTPFEYWKGPKPVLWSYYKAQAETARGSTTASNPTNTRSRKNSRTRPAPPPRNDLSSNLRLAADSTPLQPDQVHAAQRFVASLARDRNDMAFVGSSSTSSSGSRGATFSTRPGVMPGIGYDPNLKVSSSGFSSGMSRSGTSSGQYIMQAGTGGHPTEFQLSDVNSFHSSSRPGPASGFEPPPAYTESEFQRSGSNLNTGAGSWSAHAHSNSNLAGPAAASSATAGTRAMAADQAYTSEKSPAWYDWRGWGKKTWGAIAGAVIAIIVIVVVVAVVETDKAKANRYPDYTALNYTLSETYSGTTWFDNFDYFHTYDPTNGFVHYVDSSYAATYNLTYATSTSAVVKVDTSVGPSSSPDASTGRFSVRLTSKNQYNKGLFIFDVKHTPYGCATWPALWLTDPNNWPTYGEIDVMEAVNNASTGNMMTLHTDNGCDMSVKRLMTATAGQTDCNNATNSNTGCTTYGSDSTYGSEFNSAGGGLMAVEWRTAGIRMWQFGRDSIPSDITDQSPDPSSWGEALADFPNTDCDINSHFKNQSIIVNIDLCGDYTEAVWDSSGCSSDTCSNYVANNPSAFVNAYWEFGSFWIYNTTSST